MNRSDEVKIKDLPIAEQFNDNDHMIIDDGIVARKFKMGTFRLVCLSFFFRFSNNVYMYFSRA